MWVLLVLVIGVLLGITASAVFFHAKIIGSLRVDHSDPTEPPYLFLEVKKNPNALDHGCIVVLRVRRENFVTHE